ncbi:Serine/threonine-protein kinase PrkC [Thalassocella blandensis]|nr:Serine/threonine-protein kinase PrkC [Thalassocella blandensis]
MSIKIPGYQIKRILGKGGMATVYLAIQDVFEREVALKVMSKALAEDPNFGQRFFREAKIVSKLVHPNIVTVHDVGKHDGYLYLSMEYIDGHDLRYRLSQLNFRQKMQVIRDIAKALDYAGAKGYIHRDIKPENIMFHSSDQRAVLMDFGIARAAETNTTVTQTGIAIGTPHYMSPEQAKGKAVDPRSDIYSLGVVLYLMLAGRVPYDAESAVAIGIKHITEPVPLLPAAFKSLQPLLDKMMAKDVKHRFQSAGALLDALDDLDLDVIEHSAQMMSSSTWQDSDSSTTVFSQVGDADAEDFELQHHERSLTDAYSMYEAESAQARSGFSIIPWFVSACFVVSVVGGFLYVKEPQMVDAWLAKAKEKQAQWLAGTDSASEVILDEKKVKAREQQEQAQPSPAVEVVRQQTEKKSPDTAVRDEIKASPVVDNHAGEIAALRSKLAQLSAKQHDPLYLAELVKTYQALLALLPVSEKSDLNTQYEAFKQRQFTDARQQAQEFGSSASLDKKITQLKSLFPETPASEFNQLVQTAKTRKRVMSLLLEAEAYLKQSNLTQPRGRNALEAYDKVLRLDADNQTAIDGRKIIARRLVASAQKRYQSGKLQSALSVLDKSLAIYPKNGDALKLRQQIHDRLSQGQRVEDLLASADKKLKAEALFSPKGQAAYYDYAEVLRLEPGNQKAQQGMESVIDALSAKVWRLVGEKKTEEVKSVLQVPLMEMPNSERIRSLTLAVEEMIGEKVVVSNP